jgi:hypothetical protein
MTILNSLKRACRRRHYWHGSLRRAGFVSVAATITYLLIDGKTITIIVLRPLGIFIGVGNGGGWSQGLHSSRRHGIGVDGSLLTRLLFFIRVTKDDHLAVVRRPKDVLIEVAE